MKAYRYPLLQPQNAKAPAFPKKKNQKHLIFVISCRPHSYTLTSDRPERTSAAVSLRRARWYTRRTRAKDRAQRSLPLEIVPIYSLLIPRSSSSSSGHRPSLLGGVLPEDLRDAALALDLLPQVLVAREVDPLQGREAQLEREHGRDRRPRRRPPAQLVPELVHEGAADDVRAELQRVDGPYEEVPDEPADDREGEAGERDHRLVVAFQDPNRVFVRSQAKKFTSKR